MDIKQLKYFLTIVEEEQITGAAKKLHIAQPPLSQQLKLLEEELGIKLVERGSRKIRLTDAGQHLRNRAEQILKLTETTVKELKDLNEGIEGTLYMGAVSTSGALLVPERIKRFNEKYPGVNFEIWEGNTYRILEILNSGVIEIGIVRTPFDIENYGAKCLSVEPMTAVFTGNSYWEDGKSSIGMDELRNKPLIIYRRFEKLIFEVCREHGFEPRIICKNDDARTTLLWANSGMGVGIVPKSALKLIASVDLKYIEISEAKLQTQVAAIWVKDRYLSTPAKHFLEIF
jgi:DNA-binding transcriptional LysR family regulator